MAWDKIGEYLVASGLPSLLLGIGCKVLWTELQKERADHLKTLRDMLRPKDD